MKEKRELCIIVSAILMVLVLGAILLSQSGIFDKAPEVTVVPDNCYEDTLVVITDEDYSPYSFYDDAGNFSGHDVELITEIANELGMNLDLRLMNWYEAIDAMSAGEADVLMTCDYSDSFAGVAELVKCEPVSLDDFIVYSKEKIESSDALYGKRIAIMRNGNVTVSIDMMNLKQYCIEYEDNRKAMQALINDEVDYAIMRQTVGTVLLQELDAKGVEGYLSVGQSFMCFGVRDEATADEINGAIEVLKMNGDLNALHEKWLTTFIRPYTAREVIQNNIWLVAVFLVLIAITVFTFFVSLANKRRNDDEQQKKLQHAYNMASIETQRFEMLTGIIDAAKWNYGVSADDKVVSVQYGEVIRRKFAASNENNPMFWTEVVHPEDKNRVIEGFMAAIKDHSGKTTYDETFRALGADGKYIWYRSVGEVMRRDDGNGEFYGMSMDMTSQMEEQQKRLLGAVPISPDILEKENIGMWAFELDEGQPPRMYGDEAMLRLVGLDHQVPPEEMYHAWYDHIDEGSYGIVTDAVNKMSSGEHAEVQYPWHHPDGRTMVVRCGGVRNPEYTKGMRIEGTHQDVTEVLHFDDEERRALAENNTRLFALGDDIESIYDVELETGEYEVFIKGQTFSEKVSTRFVEHGDFFETSYQNIDRVAYPDDREDFKKAVALENIKEVLAHDSHFDYYYRLLVDDKPVWFRMRVVYKNAEKKNIIIGIFNAEKDVETQQLQEALNAAEAASRAKTEFLFNMSHDVRTPMNAIIGFTNIAEKNIDDREKVLDCLEKTKHSGSLLLSLINGVLDMSRIEHGSAEIVENAGDVLLSFASIEETLREEAEKKYISLSFEFGEITDRFIYADFTRCLRVFTNLITNSIKYTKVGGYINVRCEQVSQKENGYALYRYTVEDNGIGMSKDFQEHMFEPFTREYNSTTSGIQGTGLGLSVCKSFIDYLGGTIECVSEQGKGTVFTVTLPFRVQEGAFYTDILTGELIDSTSMTEDTLKEVDFSNKKVLLVEDNELNREIALDMLGEKGLVVDSAEDGTVAVDMLKEKGPDYYDVILMDVQMPIMDGYEATKAIRALPNGDRVPIIALSANAFEEDKQKSLEAGMNAHVAKPISARVLFEVMRNLV